MVISRLIKSISFPLQVKMDFCPHRHTYKKILKYLATQIVMISNTINK